MRKKLFSNFIYQASYQVLLIILPIVTIPIVSSALGPAGVGKYNFVNSIVEYFILVATLGMANYGVREISIVRGDRQELSQKFWELQVLSATTALITFIAYMIFTLTTTDVLYFMIGGISVFSSVFDITWFFAGIEDFKKITIRNFLVKLFSFILIVLFIKEPSDVYLYILIGALSILFSQLSMWISIFKYVDLVKVPFRNSLAHLRPALDFFVAKIAVTVYQNSTKTILGIMTNMAVVGIYSNAYMLVLMSGNIVNAMNTIMIPHMSNLFGKDDNEGMIKLLEKSIHLQLFFTVAIMFGINAISNNLVGWFFGEEFSQIRDVIPWLTPVVVFQSFQMAVATQYLIPKKEMKEYNISVFVGAIITVIVTITLIPLFEIYGAVVGINIGYIAVAILRAKVLYRDTTFRLNVLNIAKYLLSGLIMWLAVYLVTNSFSSSIITTIIQVIIGASVYFMLTTILKVNPLFDIVVGYFKK